MRSGNATKMKPITVLLLTSFCAALAEPELRCNSGSIHVSIPDSFLTANKISVADRRQIHFRNSMECFADRVGDSYVMTVYSPYATCGMRVIHDGNEYRFLNEIVFSSPEKYEQLMSLECRYDDKYVVSSSFALTPRVRTLNFATSQGTLSVAMNLYQRSDFHPKSKLGPRPSMVVGVPVYVSVDMDDVFGDDDIVTSLDSCYATTSEAFEVMKNYHYLITGRCASPEDGTVRILSNGQGRKARFMFQMFQWKISREEYVYLHCGVQICNKSSQVCSGQGPLCNGVTGDSAPRRVKRDIVNKGVSSDLSGFLTFGPITMATVKGEGRPSYTTKLKAPKLNQEFLTTSVISGVFGVLFLICVVVIIATVVRRHKRNQKMLSSASRDKSVDVPIHKIAPDSSFEKSITLPQT